MRNFYPRPPRGGRPVLNAYPRGYALFLSTPSARRATSSRCSRTTERRYFYPRPPRGGRPESLRVCGRELAISIHALREEGDSAVQEFIIGKENFYPRPPRGGRRSIGCLWPCRNRISIHALREEGDGGSYFVYGQVAISIHALREEGDARIRRPGMGRGISIHALREEGDAEPQWTISHSFRFLSTPSARRATRAVPAPSLPRIISIHALREEGDARQRRTCQSLWISIHALREEGDMLRDTPVLRDKVFLSTPSARRATRRGVRRSPGRFYFYPRPPRGGRLKRCVNQELVFLISIHALREEGDSKNRDKISIFKQIIQHSARI